MNLFPAFEFKDGDLILNKPEILLHPEFEAIWDKEFNKCPEDPEGEKRIRCWRIFKYLYFSEHYMSEFYEYREDDRIKASKKDSGITDEELNNPLFFLAQIKYQDILDFRELRMIKSSQRVLDNISNFNFTVNVDERDAHNKLIHNHKNIMNSISILDKTIQGLKDLETRLKKSLAKKTKNRGDTEPGLYN